MSVLGKYIKQPAETESYTIDYSDDLTDGDGIVELAVTVSDPSITLVSTNHDLLSARVWLSGGTTGVKYKIEVTATTGDGRVLQDEFFVTIKDY